ncbi:MAG: hypothetical protein DMF61_26530 [Blastocatellia bacterium AA13]|nr:MAG: hypothetical protein DMF61_26530 [Blastocatellia bacterium AA13]
MSGLTDPCMSLITVFAASRIESSPVESMTERRSRKRASKNLLHGRIGTNHVTVVTTGIGHKAARESAHALRDLSPTMVIVTGLCGGLSPSIGEGQVVVYSHCLASDGRREIPAAKELVQSVTSLFEETGIESKLVRGVSSPSLAATPAAKRALAACGAAVVDMESYELIAACNSLGIPAIVIRSVSDSFDRKLPDFSRAIDDHGSFIPLSLAVTCIASPIQTIRLLISTRRAIGNLLGAQRVLFQSNLLKEKLSSAADSAIQAQSH